MEKKISKDRPCGILADERFLGHETGAHVETPRRLRIIYDMLEDEGMWDKTVSITPRYATEEEVALNHSTSYIKMLKGMGAGCLDADTVLSEKSFDVALLAAGGCLNMADAVMEGTISRGFALVRPPGHHAEMERGMGFCLFNNIAIAARHLLKKYDLKRIAVVDWDLHHGNGTQHSFYDEKEVLYISIHQSPCYPGTGMLNEVGEEEGEGFTVNLPIPAGVGDDGYIQAFEELFLPIISRYRPEIILVSAGFDPHMDDPLGGMDVTAGGFGVMGKMLMDISEGVCNGKMAFFLEGGYSLDGLRESVREVLLRAVGEKGKKGITMGTDLKSVPITTLDSIIKKAKSIHEPYWGNL